MRSGKIFIVLMALSMMIGCEDDSTNIDVIDMYFISKYLKEQTVFLVNKPKEQDGPFPVLYLLNGYGADAYAWASGANLQKAADDYGMLIVSATADYNWYVDIPNDSSKWYMSYVLEIINIVDTAFNTIPDKNHRALCGISNGGKGAVYISSHNPNKFCSASSLSAGTYSGYQPVYDSFRSVDLLIEVGTEDTQLGNCRWLHQKLRDQFISHEYNEFSGDHDWKFWGKRYKYHFKFHYDNFDL